MGLLRDRSRWIIKSAVYKSNCCRVALGRMCSAVADGLQGSLWGLRGERYGLSKPESLEVRAGWGTPMQMPEELSREAGGHSQVS